MRTSAAFRRACPGASAIVPSARWADAARVRNGLRPASLRYAPPCCHAVPPAPAPLEGEGDHAHVVEELQGRHQQQQELLGQQSEGAPWQLMGRMVPEEQMPGLLGRQLQSQQRSQQEKEVGTTWQQQQQLPAGLMGRQQQEDAAFMRQIARQMLRWGQRGWGRRCTLPDAQGWEMWVQALAPLLPLSVI